MTTEATRRWFWAGLLGLAAAGFLLRLAAAIGWPTIERPDEIFQNLEPAYRLWTGRGVVTWEWREGVRSWLFPGLLSAAMSFTSLLHLPEAAALPAIWAGLAALSCGVVVVGVGLGRQRGGMAGAVLCGLLTAFWPDLVYFGPKTLGEVQAGNLLVIAAGLASAASARREGWRQAAVGLLLGAAFDLRFQLALSLLLVACWSARTDPRRWALLSLGAALPLAILGIVDAATLGSPFQSVWKNVQVNLFQNKAEFYGVTPVYAYATMLIARNGAAALVMAALFALGARRAPLLALAALGVVAFHSLIPHKELSFVCAALPCTMVVIGLGLARLVTEGRAVLVRPPAPGTALAAAAAVTLTAIGAQALAEQPFKAAAPQAELRTLWGYAHGQPDLCGLALYTDDEKLWSKTGGYVALARPVPIYLPMTPGAFAESRDAFSHAVAHRLLAPEMAGFDRVYCGREYCLFRQPVRCHPVPAHEISAALARTDQ